MNRSNKGTRSGGIGRFSSMVVVGNYQVAVYSLLNYDACMGQHIAQALWRAFSLWLAPLRISPLRVL